MGEWESGRALRNLCFTFFMTCIPDEVPLNAQTQIGLSIDDREKSEKRSGSALLASGIECDLKLAAQPRENRVGIVQKIFIPQETDPRRLFGEPAVSFQEFRNHDLALHNCQLGGVRSVES